uniref:Uncharacterized protein n=1 Tax=Glossina austeni TaxID=7395 RepID=A0A1A9VEQ2_GLOAU
MALNNIFQTRPCRTKPNSISPQKSQKVGALYEWTLSWWDFKTDISENGYDIADIREIFAIICRTNKQRQCLYRILNEILYILRRTGSFTVNARKTMIIFRDVVAGKLYRHSCSRTVLMSYLCFLAFHQQEWRCSKQLWRNFVPRDYRILYVDLKSIINFTSPVMVVKLLATVKRSLLQKVGASRQCAPKKLCITGKKLKEILQTEGVEVLFNWCYKTFGPYFYGYFYVLFISATVYCKLLLDNPCFSSDAQVSLSLARKKNNKSTNPGIRQHVLELEERSSQHARFIKRIAYKIKSFESPRSCAKVLPKHI